MARDIVFTFRSCADLNEIWEAIAMPRDIYGSAGSDNLSAAEDFADRFEHLCGLLPDHPEIGLTRDELHDGVRSVPFHRYVMFYRERGDRIEVLRVLPASSDVAPGLAA
ncbi:MAG TPA: type II toxin-antitoxin system RelE/ParE family toxin [Casimicrobiaceae bacterium]|nr:type II toxin-antitoxin system RelE/ParE family toxin [Casimicrobiaceae bacterium]